MRCINNKKKYFVIFLHICIFSFLLSGCNFFGQTKELGIVEYEAIHYTSVSYRGELYSKSLCVTNEDVNRINFSPSESLTRIGLFDLNNREVLYAKDIHYSLYPASTTKIMTALVALEHGNLDDIVTISRAAAADSFQWNEQICGLKEGEQVTLFDLLNGLILYSGNDTSVAIAEHISGDVQSFAKLMNEKARELMATRTNYVNPHGLHDDDQYTTVYDLYLIFNEAINNETFMNIIEHPSYTMTLTAPNGMTREIKCDATNYYAFNRVEHPTAARVIGGKTGTTNEAGSCVVLYNVDSENNPYISIIMNASSRAVLYDNMTNLINGVATIE